MDNEQFELLYPFTPQRAVDGLQAQGSVSCVIHPLLWGRYARAK